MKLTRIDLIMRHDIRAKLGSLIVVLKMAFERKSLQKELPIHF